MYKVEDMKFLNMPVKRKTLLGPNGRENTYSVFEIEDELSIEEKITFIDEVENGVATYLLNIFNKWEKDYNELKKDACGNVKTVSKKAWIKRNDTKGLIDVDDCVGAYFLLGNRYYEMSITHPHFRYKCFKFQEEEHIVNQWFHDLCNILYGKEKKYFQEIDPVSIKIKKVKEYAGFLGILDNKIINDIYYNGKIDVTEEVLDSILEGYGKLETYYNMISKEVKESLIEHGCDASEEEL